MKTTPIIVGVVVAVLVLLLTAIIIFLYRKKRFGVKNNNKSNNSKIVKLNKVKNESDLIVLSDKLMSPSFNAQTVEQNSFGSSFLQNSTVEEQKKLKPIKMSENKQWKIDEKEVQELKYEEGNYKSNNQSVLVENAEGVIE
ncbi:Hypothetical_protein [Hexamita inflata]|uniref:Hypothetical_protein n=1 Tax=Hexamita inflata TaxID=28002 RepID=A0AA86U254_9EUKA|nr:Hypothetical protein HINF_LOCUS23042 [Hexamita inflata]